MAENINEAYIFQVKANLDQFLKQLKTAHSELSNLKRHAATAGVSQSADAKKLKAELDQQLKIENEIIRAQITRNKLIEKEIQLQKQLQRESANVANQAARNNQARATSGASAGIGSMISGGRQISQMGQGVSQLATGLSSLSRFAPAMGAVAVGFKAIEEVGRGVEFNKMVESTQAMFNALLRDGPAAQKLMDDLRAVTLRTSISFEQAADSSKQLLAYGFRADQIVNTMQTLGSVTAATGGRLDDLAYVYGTLRTQGRAYSRDLMQFAMRGIPIYDELAKVVGKPVQKIKEMTEAGMINFKEVEQAFKNMTQGEGIYANAIDARLGTLAGKQELFAKRWEMFMGSITTGINSMLGSVIDVFDRIFDPARLDSIEERLRRVSAEKALTENTSDRASLFREATGGQDPFGESGSLRNTVTLTLMELEKTAKDLSKPFKAVLDDALKMGLVTQKMYQDYAAIAESVAQTLAASEEQARLREGVDYSKEGYGGQMGDLLTLAGGSIKSFLLSQSNVAQAADSELKTLSTSGQGQADSMRARQILSIYAEGGEAAAKRIAAVLEKDLQSLYIESVESGSQLGQNIVQTSQMPIKELEVIRNAGGIAADALKELQIDAINDTIGNLTKAAEALAGVVVEETSPKGKLSGKGAVAQGAIPEINKQISIFQSQLSSLTKKAITEIKPTDILERIVAKGTVDQIDDVQLELKDTLMKINKEYDDWSETLRKNGKTESEISNILAGRREQAIKITERQYEILTALEKQRSAQVSTIGSADQIAGIEQQLKESANAQIDLYQKSQILAQQMDAAGKSVTKYDAQLADVNSAFQKLSNETNKMRSSGVATPEVAGQIADRIWEEGASIRLAEATQAFNIGALKEAADAELEELKAQAVELAKQRNLQAARTKQLEDQLRKAKELQLQLSNYQDAELKLAQSTTDANRAGLASIGGNTQTQIAANQIDLQRQVAQYELDRINAKFEFDKELADEQAVLEKANLTDEQRKVQQANIDYLNKKFAMEEENAAILLQIQKKQAERAQQELINQLATQGDPQFWQKLQDQLVNSANNIMNPENMGIGRAGMPSDVGQRIQQQNTGQFAQAAGASMLQGTELGTVMSGGNPILAFVDAIGKALMSIESFAKVANFATTIVEALFKVIGPLINGVFKPFANTLEWIGIMLGEVLSPIMSFIAILTTALYPVIVLLLMPLQLLTAALQALSDFLIDGVINPMVDTINAFITGINDLLGTHIPLLDRLQNSAERLAEEEEKRAKQLQQDRLKDMLSATISYLNDKLREFADKTIKSAQDLYEVGAITGSQYQQKVEEANKFLTAEAEKNVNSAALAAQTVQEMYAVMTAAQLLKDTMDAEVELTREQIDLVLETTRSAAEGFTSVGGSLMAVVQGMTTLPQEVTQKMVDLAGPVMEAFAEQLLIQAKTLQNSELSALQGVATAASAMGTLPASIVSAMNTALNALTIQVAGGGTVGSASNPTPVGQLTESQKQANKKALSETIFGIDLFAGMNQLFAGNSKSSYLAYYTGLLEKAQKNPKTVWGTANPEIAIYERVIAAINQSGSFAVGTANVPRDMMANIHQGEGIVPATFMDSIRSGDLTLSGGSSGATGGDVYVTVQVEGSVQAENDLAETIANAIYRGRKRGVITV